MKVVHSLTCASCQGRIREFEPDIVLTSPDGSEKYFYHVGCGRAAQRVVSEGEPDAWSLTHRHLFWDAGGGAA